MTRLSSSSPVAATTTSQRSSPAWRSDVDLARVGDEPLDALGSACSALDDARVLLDEQHLVAGAHEVVGDEEADVAGAGDRDPHQCSPPAFDVRLQLVERVHRADEHEHVAFLADHVAGDDLRLARTA